MFYYTSYNESDGLDGFDWGALIGGGLSFGSSVVGGILGGKAADKQLKAIQEANKLKAMELEQQRLAMEAERSKGGISNTMLMVAGVGLLAVMMMMKK